MVDVAGDGRGQRGQVHILFFIAQLLEEFHPHQLAVAIALEIQQMGFQQHPAAVVHRRAHAQAGHGRQGLRGQAMHLHHEDARERRTLVAHAHVQRRESDGAAQLLAVHDPAADGVGMTQQLLRQGEVRIGQRSAHGRRGDAHTGVGDRGQGMYLEAILLAGGDQGVEGAGAAGAEAEVVTDHQPAHVQALHQDLLDEILRREGREMAAEMLHHHPVDAGVGECFELVTQVGDARRGAFGRAGQLGEELARMRLEGHHRRVQPQLGGGLAHARQEGLVAQMHAVEIADGQRARGARFGCGKSAKYLH